MGAVSLAQPLACSVLAAFLAGIVILAVAFASTGTYARRETVSGFLSPDQGLVVVNASRAGVIGHLHVREGQDVVHGAPLLTLFGDRVADGGVAVDRRMLEMIERQLDENRARQELEARRRAAEEERLVAQLAGTGAERSAIDAQIAIQQQLLRRLQQNYDRVRDVHRRGYASSDDLAGREEKILASRQVVAGLEQQRAASDSSLELTRIALDRLPVESDERLSKLESVRADLLLKQMDLEGRRSATITAPVAGKVAALRAIAGTSVHAGSPLLTIIPEGGRLEAHLYVPTRAIGFVAVGQEVRLLYDAFDYRRFGAHTGEIREVSSTVFPSHEPQAGMRLEEPAYRVTATIARQSVDAFGVQFPLQAGMTVRADIILEERPLILWLLDPLISLRGRT